jgi:trimeric autotransporter adhesin
MTNLGITKSSILAKIFSVGILAVFLGLPTLAQKAKEGKDALDQLVFVRNQSWLTLQADDVKTLGEQAAPLVRQDLASLEAASGNRWVLMLDRITGKPSLVEGGIPWVPGDGLGNALRAQDLGVSEEQAAANQIPVQVVASKALEFMKTYPNILAVDPSELVLMGEASGPVLDYLYNVSFAWQYQGIPVENARVTFCLNSGNLVMFGAQNISDTIRGLDAKPSISTDVAWEILWGFLGKTSPQDKIVEPGRLLIQPETQNAVINGLAYGAGQGLAYRLVYVLSFRRPGVLGTWEGRVDAHTGEVVEFKDVNNYGHIQGGVYKTDKNPTQTEVVMPFPYADYGTSSFADAAGNFTGGTGTGTMTGRTGSTGNVGAVDIVDSCGAISKSADANGLIDFGSGTGTDCTVPVSGGGTGNTHAARTQYWNIAQIKIKAYTYLPTNTWLQGRLTDNVNLNQTCNAYWNGSSLNFFKSGGGCNNTGELPGVSLHEFGHGMDSNDGNGSSPDGGTGEVYGDTTAMLQTHQSCLGGGFLGSNCGGYGWPCTNCTGVREANYALHSPATMATPTNFNQVRCPAYTGPTTSCKGPCNYECHCEDAPGIQANWDLAVRVLTAVPYNLDVATAWQFLDRFWYASAPNRTAAFACGNNNSSAVGNLFNQYRVVDDCDGVLTNGTPHAAGIWTAMSNHGIGNSSAVSTDNNCGCTTLATPVLSGTAGNGSAALAWSAVTGAASYDVYRNETGCTAGYTKVGNTGTLAFTDTPLANGVTYFYVIQAKGTGSCPPSAMSNCLTLTPAVGPSAVFVLGSATIGTPVGGDADVYLDNCESAPVSFQVFNDGNANLTNVRVTITTSTPSVTIMTSMPVNLGSLAMAGTATGSFNIELGTGATAAACGDMLSFSISITSDQQAPNTTNGAFTLGPVEEDRILQGSRTDSFEAGMDGWSGTFTRDNTKAALGSWSLHSSSGVNGACDAALSPTMGVTASSSVVISVQYDIEATSSGTVWDKANVHAIDVATGTHTLLTPTGRTYNVTGVSGDPLCHITNDAGWNGTIAAFADATFNLSTLAGKTVQIEVNYNTDSAAALTGIWMDNVRWSNVYAQVCDIQADLCNTCSAPGAPTLTTATGTCSGVNLAWTAGTGTTNAYNVYRYTGACGGAYAKIAGPVTGLSYADTSAVAGTSYAYVVRGTCDAGGVTESGNSNCLTAARLTTPAAPTAGNNGPVCAGSTLNLTASTVTGATYAWTGPNGFTSSAQNPSIAAATVAASGTYSVTATVGGCTSPAGTTTATVTAVPAAPATPTFSSISCTSLTVSWSTVSGATGYDVYRVAGTTCTGAVKINGAAVAGTSYPDSGLNAGTQYSYYIVAKNACGDSTNGSCGTTTTTVCTPNIVYSANGPWTQVAGMGNGDAVVDPGESWDVVVTVTNSGTATATNVVASLTATSASFCTGTASFGTIGIGGTANATFRLAVVSAFTCGNDLSFNLVNKASAEGTYADQAGVFTKKVGTAGGGTPVTYAQTAGLPLAIPDNNSTGVNSSLTISDTGTIADLNINLGVTHTYVGDLMFTLTHVDTGTAVTFIDRPGVPASTYGCSGNNIAATLDDSAALPVETQCGGGTPTISGTFSPNNPLSAFNGQDLAGTWQLNTSDRAGGDTGSLTSWSLTITTAGSICNVWAGANCAALPLKVPYSVTPMSIIKNNADATDIAVTWDASNCASPDYHILWGYGANVGTLATGSPTISGGKCDIGSAGSLASWNTGVPDPANDPGIGKFVWFLVAGDNNGTTEGSWGLTSAGGERGGSNPSNQCSCTTKDTSGSCGTP